MQVKYTLPREFEKIIIYFHLIGELIIFSHCPLTIFLMIGFLNGE